MKRFVAVIVVVGFAVVFAFAQKDLPYQQIGKYHLPGEGGWDYLRYDPDGNRLFIAHGTSYLVVNADDGKTIGQIPAEGAHGVALVPDKGIGFAANGRAGTVTVFDLKTLAAKSEIKVGEGPDSTLYDEHSKRVIVMNSHGKEVSVIDPETLKVEKTIPLGGGLEEAAADKGHVYVNIEDQNQIAVIDSKTWTVTAQWKLDGCDGPGALAIDEKRGVLFAACGNAKMFLVSTSLGKVIGTVPTGNGTDGGGYDSGLNLAFSSNGGSGTLSVIRQNKDGNYESAGNVPTQRGARTMALDPKTHKVFLVTADFGPPVEGQRRPPILPNTFVLLVYGPAK